MLFQMVVNLYQNSTVNYCHFLTGSSKGFIFMFSLSFPPQSQEIRDKIRINNVYVTNVNTGKSESILIKSSKSF